jgi:hypothetical protein
MMGRASQAQAALAVVSTLPEVVEGITGLTSFIDLSFPRTSLIGSPPVEATRMLWTPRSDIEKRFLERFRQSGGHAPIASVDFDDEFTWPSALLQANTAAVVILENENAVNAAGQWLREKDTSMLCPMPSGGPPVASLDDGNLQGYRRVHLIDCNGGPSYFLFQPRSLKRLKSGERWSAAPRTDDVYFSADGSNAVIEARSVIHDGGYVSEGDLKYSWLWTGPSTHFRLILPQIAGIRPRRAELCIPRTEQDTNLDCLVVQMDGRTIEHRLDRWSPTSGKVGVEIPRGDDYCVLTLVVPKPTHDANSGRLLGLCIDKVILTP